MFFSWVNFVCVDFKDVFVVFVGWCRDIKLVGVLDVMMKMFYCVWKLNEVRKLLDLILEDMLCCDFYLFLVLDL